MKINQKLGITLALCFQLLCFSLAAKTSEQKQRRVVKPPEASSSKHQPDRKRSVQKPSSKFDRLRSDQRRRIPSSSADPRESGERLEQQQPLQQATGIILAFHELPSEEEQNRISETLKTEGLTLTKTFQSFKSLVFSWENLKTRQQAENACSQVSDLQNLKYCEPDMLLHPNK